MAFTHTNKVTYNYSSGGKELDTSVSVSETNDAEANIEEAHTLIAPVTGSSRHQWDVPGFELSDLMAPTEAFLRTATLILGLQWLL
jgi:hypothetical protein